MSFYWMLLSWVSICLVLFAWVSYLWMSFCTMSFCWMLYRWMSFRWVSFYKILFCWMPFPLVSFIWMPSFWMLRHHTHVYLQGLLNMLSPVEYIFRKRFWKDLMGKWGSTNRSKNIPDFRLIYALSEFFLKPNRIYSKIQMEQSTLLLFWR